MPTNIVFDAHGYQSGIQTVLTGFEEMVYDYFTADSLEPLISILSGAVVIVGIWYGVRAILRAMRTPR